MPDKTAPTPEQMAREYAQRFTFAHARQSAAEDWLAGYRACAAADCPECAALREQVAAMQARIDALMLEFCPDEMTPEQVEEWGKHQRPVDTETMERIDAAMRSRAPSAPPECEHPNLRQPEFDEHAAATLSSGEVRRRWPRGDERCPDCGSRVIRYASLEHYVAGDW